MLRQHYYSLYIGQLPRFLLGDDSSTVFQTPDVLIKGKMSVTLTKHPAQKLGLSAFQCWAAGIPVVQCIDAWKPATCPLVSTRALTSTVNSNEHYRGLPGEYLPLTRCPTIFFATSSPKEGWQGQPLASDCLKLLFSFLS